MNLKIGISGEKLRLRALQEMLSHQGVIFEEFNEKEEYPCVISTGDNPEYINRDNVIVADEIIHMTEIISALSGTLKNNLQEPEVNYCEIKLVGEIRKVFFEQNMPFIRKWFWPNFAKYCCIITHDIDNLSIPPNFFRKEAPILIKGLMTAKYYFQRYVLGKKKYNDYIDIIIGLENKYKVKSSFYFFPNYEGVDSGEFIKLLYKLREGKFEVGLHSKSTNLEELEEEVEELERKSGEKVFGARQHGLIIIVPQTWEYQEKLLDYDLSFYRNEEFGFRAGLCFPYRPLNTSSIIEIPTSFMDWSAIFEEMTYEQIKRELSRLIKQIEIHNGCLVFNFHNEYFNRLLYPHIYRTFIYILKYIQKDCWVTTAKECVEWWKKRESVKIDFEFKNKNIVGTSSEEVPLVIEYQNGNINYLNVNGVFSVDCSK